MMPVHVALRKWYKLLCDLSPRCGYNVNAAKTWLVVKLPFQTMASELFAGTGVNLSSEGRPYLGATIETRDYILIKRLMSGLLR